MSAAVRITVELDPACAAGLKRFAEKVSRDQAASVLYPHVNAAVRDDQAGDILVAFVVLLDALSDAGVTSWPWVETRHPK